MKQLVLLGGRGKTIFSRSVRQRAAVIIVRHCYTFLLDNSLTSIFTFDWIHVTLRRITKHFINNTFIYSTYFILFYFLFFIFFSSLFPSRNIFTTDSNGNDSDEFRSCALRELTGKDLIEEERSS